MTVVYTNSLKQGIRFKCPCRTCTDTDPCELSLSLKHTQESTHPYLHTPARLVLNVCRQLRAPCDDRSFFGGVLPGDLYLSSAQAECLAHNALAQPELADPGENYNVVFKIQEMQKQMSGSPKAEGEETAIV